MAVVSDGSHARLELSKHGEHDQTGQGDWGCLYVLGEEADLDTVVPINKQSLILGR